MPTKNPNHPSRRSLVLVLYSIAVKNKLKCKQVAKQWAAALQWEPKQMKPSIYFISLEKLQMRQICLIASIIFKFSSFLQYRATIFDEGGWRLWVNSCPLEIFQIEKPKAKLCFIVLESGFASDLFSYTLAAYQLFPVPWQSQSGRTSLQPYLQFGRRKHSQRHLVSKFINLFVYTHHKFFSQVIRNTKRKNTTDRMQ